MDETSKIMKTVSIQELHAKTHELMREISVLGEIVVTDNGRTIAKIVPVHDEVGESYFAQRRPSSAFLKLDNSGKTGRGIDATQLISDDREDQS